MGYQQFLICTYIYDTWSWNRRLHLLLLCTYETLKAAIYQIHSRCKHIFLNSQLTAICTTIKMPEPIPEPVTQNMRVAKPNVNHKHRNSSLPCGFDIYDSDRETDRRTGQKRYRCTYHRVPKPSHMNHHKMNHDTSVSAFAFINFNKYEQAREKSQFTSSKLNLRPFHITLFFFSLSFFSMHGLYSTSAKHTNTQARTLTGHVHSRQLVLLCLPRTPSLNSQIILAQ